MSSETTPLALGSSETTPSVLRGAFLRPNPGKARWCAVVSIFGLVAIAAFHTRPERHAIATSASYNALSDDAIWGIDDWNHTMCPEMEVLNNSAACKLADDLFCEALDVSEYRIGTQSKILRWLGCS